MENQTNIQKIYRFLEHAKLANIRNDENAERENLSNLFELYEKTPRDSRVRLDTELYIPFRNIARFFFTSNQYEDTLKYFQKAMSHPDFLDELIDNKINMKLILCHSNLMLYLEDKSPNFLQVANDLLEVVCQEIPKINNPSLFNDFLEKQEIYSKVLQDDLWTIIEFDLPFPMIVSEHPISFIYNGTQIELLTIIEDSPFKLFKTENGGFSEILEDKYGLANRSKVRLSINKYLSPDQDVRINTLSESNCVSCLISECINVLNFFIERFRVTTDQYWIETISHKMITKHNILIKAGNQIIRNIPFTDSTSIFRYSPSIPWITEELKSLLIENLNKDELPLWMTLLLDSKDYLLRGKNRESIVSINSAFENFLLTETKSHLAKGMEEDEINEFFLGIPNYNEFFLKQFISEDNFNTAIQSGLITNYPPTTFTIIKKCNEISPLGISKRQLQRLVSKIRGKRNDIVHGKENLVVSSKEVKQSIESFEELIKLFK